MRPELLEILQCPGCRQSNWRLKSLKEDNREIRRGALTCAGCQSIYSINNGILDCLVGGHPWIESAQRSYRRSKTTTAQKWSPEQLARRKHLENTYTSDSRANFAQLIKRLPAGEGWALDMGAGTGWTTAQIAALGYRSIALDISADNKLELGECFFDRNIYFDRILADMNRLPFKAGSLSLAAASAVLHHSYDLSGAVREISRTLVPNGRLELANEPVKGLAEAFLSRPGNIDEDVKEASYSLSTWRALLLRYGLENRIYFPQSIQLRLAKNNFNPRHKFFIAARAVSGLARSAPGLLFGGFSLKLGHALFGLPLSLSARKMK
ncbi:methyltransferase domain-containing protein [candidate division TA06 bacterium]|uniref:Methyltransferase domain-containing protein n=1 Tax=candidate division TA06 bacterium TaxID=2250710 RepID=A0A933MJ18_UNCT6|nr:methyltransferase domain-containing protein [candidate division TA06 bacterium]